MMTSNDPQIYIKHTIPSIFLLFQKSTNFILSDPYVIITFNKTSIELKNEIIYFSWSACKPQSEMLINDYNTSTKVLDSTSSVYCIGSGKHNH